MKKKLIVLLLGSIMVAGLAVGCGKKEEVVEDKNVSVVEETEKSEEEQIVEKLQEQMGYGFEVSYDKDKKEIHVLCGSGFYQNVNEMYSDYVRENREDDFYKTVCYNVIMAKETVVDAKEYIETSYDKDISVVVDFTIGQDIVFSINDKEAVIYDDPLKEIPFDSKKHEGIEGNWYEAESYWFAEDDGLTY